ncbi:hypothetical protein [Streptomyces sp. NPDC001843]|uniref:hypothetical protein n=1 Tax=Streptomyces sp. NPDC001843 TaxID=3364617 RepID=UPI0036C63A3A
MAANCCPTGDGGNSNITNQDECLILAATIAAVPIQNTALGTEDDSHVSIGYRDADVAGS